MRPSVTARNDGGSKDPLSLSAFKNSLRLRPSNSPPPQRMTAIGGTDALPLSVFGKEMRERKDGEESSAMKTEFVKVYSYEELGEKLKKLRPKGKGEGRFSMEELNQRLMKLREIEQKETESRIAGLPFRELRESLVALRLSSDTEKAGKASSK